VSMHRVFLAAVIGVCAVSLPCALAQDQEKLAVTHGPYLQGVTESSATVIWFTNKTCVSRVEYAPQGTSADSSAVMTAVAGRHGLIDASAGLQKITLTRLEPGVRYEYRIISREIAKFDPYEVVYGDTLIEGPYRMQTWNPRKSGYSFCVINDIHEKTDRLNSLLDMVPWETTDMMFLNGDMIDHWTRENQVFDGFLDTCVRRFARETPFVYVRGNHETRGALARGLLDLFPTPAGRYYYGFRHGPISFLVLDGGEDKPDANKEYSGLVDFDAYRAEQTRWLREAVQGESFRRSRYRIVFVHMPPSATSPGHGVSQIHQLWSPILNRSRIDLMLCAHTHRFARIEPVEWANHYPILINAPDMMVHVDVSESRLGVTVTKLDGQVVESFELQARSW